MEHAKNILLNTHSYYSFRYGTLKPEMLLEWARKQGITRLPLTDINTTAGTIEWIRLASEQGMEPVAGIDFRNGINRCYVALCQDNTGFYEVNAHLSHHLQAKTPLPAEAPAWDHTYVIYPFEKAPRRLLRENEFIGLEVSHLSRLKFSPWKYHQEKLVILQPATFRHQRDFNTHRLLRAIDNNTLLSKLPEAEQASSGLLPTPQELQNYFAEFPQVIENTQRLLADCHIHFKFKDYNHTFNKTTFTGSVQQDRTLLKEKAYEGMLYRFGGRRTDIEERIEKELTVIDTKAFHSYFLINWDITRYARHHGYFYVGRGSGANSMIAYLLRITDVDPIELDLYFERFINPSRRNPPDFDIDFSWRDREDVTRYIFEKYPYAALLGAHTTFKYRAVTREIGKVLGLPPREIDQLSHPRLNVDQLDDVARLVLKYGQYIQGFPNNMTVHSSGILIPERSIHHYGATILPPKGFATTHFDMYMAEDIGLYKFDILGQRGLGKIKDAITLIRQNQPEAPDIDIHDMPLFKKDPRIKEMVSTGDTLGCFYVESPAMRGLFKKLRAKTYLDVVAASSVIRPGVAQSGMMQEYIRRFREPERRKLAHPALMKIMPETFGLMIYQEDVMRVAHHFAGLTLEEADVLRRGMSWKFKQRNEFDTVKEKYFSNCQVRGIDADYAKEVWRQIESFGNFAFAKGHSASYAVESFQSLFLKAHYPLEYMVATVNNGGGFFRREVYLNEARLHGGIIEPPCINRSEAETVIDGQHIFLGLQFIKELEDKVIISILEERCRYGPFTDLADLVNRVAISLDQLILLIRINALRQTGKGKKELLWEAHFLLGNARKSNPHPDLFKTRPPDCTLPELDYTANEDAFDEIELLGFPLSSPFRLIHERPEGIVCAAAMEANVGRHIQMLGYLVHVKSLDTRSKNPQHMQFGCFLDEEGAFIDTVHFPATAARYSFQGKGIYHLKGKVVKEYDFISLEVTWMDRLPWINAYAVDRFKPGLKAVPEHQAEDKRGRKKAQETV